jgi:hypothetical protein
MALTTNTLGDKILRPTIKLNQIYPMKLMNPMDSSIQRNPLGIKNGT